MSFVTKCFWEGLSHCCSALSLSLTLVSMIMSSSTAPLLIACSTTSESDSRTLQTNRAESSIMNRPWQASSPGHDNSTPLSVVVPGHGAMDVVPLTADRLFMAPNEPCMGAWHGTSRGSLRKPCFYKMVSEYSVEGGPACWMQVPSAFVRKHMPQVDRKQMVLENADGKPWPVVYLAEHGFFTGWAAFSTANNLAIGDILFFSFVEEAKFAVHVFGKSGCEKRVPTETPLTNPSGDPGGEKKGPRWEKTWSKIHARALVTKAILRKTNITPLFMARHRNSVKKRSFAESVESDGEVGFDASSGYDGEGRRQRRSFSKDGAFVSSPDDEDEDEAAPDYVQQRRKPGRPRKYPPPIMPEQPRRGFPDSSDGGQTIEKRKRGRPFKHQIPGEIDINGKPLREIFVSRRRKVTEAERDDALKSAYRFASHLKSSTTFVVVMRQSFVYFSFVLGVPRRFANRYLPKTNRKVILVDEAWRAWYCAWNAMYNYISGRGWRNFALMHCIEEDDALLMEILEDSEVALKIKVHIFRVVPIPEGVTGWHSHVCPPNPYMDPNSGVPIEPMLHPPGKIQPRLTHHKQATGKRVRREPVYIHSSSSAEELDFRSG